ncbi:MAG: OsmC family protein [Maribacter dokdonensis]|uniref:OsmC family protein n=1 Tax=Maribacter dokdonensis TaxID=320912 RepID=UPI0032679453
MNYSILATSQSKNDATIHVKESVIDFGTTAKTTNTLPNPAELFLSSFAACMLKNVERFSMMMKFDYHKTSLEVSAVRLENPSRMNDIEYSLTIYSDDDAINKSLLKKNIEKYGTIYNTIKQSCTITGSIKITATS